MADQNSWMQPGAPQGGGQSNLPGENVLGSQSGSAQSGTGGQMGRDPLDQPLDQLRQHFEGQIHQAIDQYAGKVPGGTKFADSAKRAASGILDQLERQADTQVDSRLGGLPGMGGKYDPNAAGGNNGSSGGML